ncbi:MAG: WG repeat-containing protein [Sporocytophaga sp.]|uniref:WG repeat-containing protein n=1 Tax=Sporocytophaga sp. TaxID=2231183 RepID=UPI001B1113C5|nr:WG repeat-containing protein [Sporocytophaga sp.]MBO9702590.1 WG repeat-containing protein [Sporocytophaga sp.]
MNSRIIVLLLLTISNLTWGQGNGLYKFIGKNGRYGFIDEEGNVKVKPEYLSVNDFNDGLSFVSKKIVKKDYKWICIDTLGRKVFEIDDFPETEFSEGFARISDGFGQHFFINKRGEKVFNKVWKDGQDNFKNGIAYVSDIQFSNFYPIDTQGNRIGSETYNRHGVYLKQNDTTTVKTAEKLLSFKQDSLWGFKDLSGKVVIQPKYYLVDKFENGLCAVRLNYQAFDIADYYLDTIINEKGEIVSQQPMHCYLGFQGELIEYYGGFHFSGGVHYLDKRGQKVILKE